MVWVIAANLDGKTLILQMRDNILLGQPVTGYLRPAAEPAPFQGIQITLLVERKLPRACFLHFGMA